MKTESSDKSNRWTTLALIGFCCIFFVLGFGVAVHFYHELFGYRNAEECAIDGVKNRWQIDACYELYPSVHDGE